jgi:NADH-quinone oxidoreductase subunit C
MISQLQKLARELAGACHILLPEGDLPLPVVAAPPSAPSPAPVGTGPVAAPPAVAPAPSAPPAPAPLPIQLTDFNFKGYHLDATVDSNQVVEAAQVLERNGFGMEGVTGVDWMAAGQMEVVYDFFHPTSPLRIVVHTRIPREQPELPTIQGVFPGANWHEREAHDFFGIKFLGHPDLSPLLLEDDATYHPLRKDFAL